jgi:antitoxin component YwqK of YwqJK toxin-antitoxin module
MKQLVTLVTMLFLFNISYSQSDTVFTSEQILRINNYIDSLHTELVVLERQQELNSMLIEEYKKGNDELSDLLNYKERYIKVREAQYSLMEESLDSYREYIKANKRPFWDKPIVWFIVGAGTIYFSSTIVANIK